MCARSQKNAVVCQSVRQMPYGLSYPQQKRPWGCQTLHHGSSVTHRSYHTVHSLNVWSVCMWHLTSAELTFSAQISPTSLISCIYRVINVHGAVRWKLHCSHLASWGHTFLMESRLSPAGVQACCHSGPLPFRHKKLQKWVSSIKQHHTNHLKVFEKQRAISVK